MITNYQSRNQSALDQLMQSWSLTKRMQGQNEDNQLRQMAAPTMQNPEQYFKAVQMKGQKDYEDFIGGLDAKDWAAYMSMGKPKSALDTLMLFFGG